MEVSLRPALATDAEAVARLTTQLGYDVASADAATRLSRILSRSDQMVVIAEIGGSAVGWIHAAIWQDIDAEAFVVIGGLVVDRSHRRMGIGRMLLEQAEQWAKQQGCSIVRLWSSTTRTETHRFYERVGYTNVKTQHAFIKSLDSSRADDFERFVPRVEQ